MADCKCDLGNILDEETFNVRVIRELCNISNSVGTTELLRMVDQTDGGDVQFIRTSNGDFELDGETSYTPIGTVIPYKRNDSPSPVPSQYIIADSIQIATNQYINTEVPAIPQYTESEFKVMWVGSSTGTRGLYGVRGANSADYRSYCVFLTVSGSGPRWDNCGGSNFSSNWSTGETHVVQLTHADRYGKTIVDGETVATGSTSMSTTSYDYIHLNTIYTRVTSSVNTGGTMRWYYCKIWADETTLSADMIPVYDTVTQAGGMYDLVRQQFYGGGNPDGNTITAYDANDNPITGGNLLGMSPNLMMSSTVKNKPVSKVTIIGPDEEEER